MQAQLCVTQVRLKMFSIPFFFASIATWWADLGKHKEPFLVCIFKLLVVQIKQIKQVWQTSLIIGLNIE